MHLFIKLERENDPTCSNDWKFKIYERKDLKYHNLLQSFWHYSMSRLNVTKKNHIYFSFRIFFFFFFRGVYQTKYLWINLQQNIFLSYIMVTLVLTINIKKKNLSEHNLSYIFFFFAGSLRGSLNRPKTMFKCIRQI